MLIGIIVSLSGIANAVGQKPAPPLIPREPEFHAIIIGISDYSGTALDLRYAAKDAETIADTLNTGANRLFGKSKTHITLLTTTKRSNIISPTRQNIQQAFEKTAQQSMLEDVLLIYLAGHGTMQGQDLYCYLTSDARSIEDLADPGLRQATSITSEDLKRWLSKIKARKQVLILDTCAAAASSGSFLGKRDVSAEQERALARLKEREGLHILMGCAADASSYESSQYGQGLLTHALLEGMAGAALRNGNNVDISTLFQYTIDRVPVLAKNIGGIQRPMVAIPYGSSFDIGLLEKQDRQPPPSPNPIIIRPMLMNPETIGDNLQLTTKLLSKLRSINNETSNFIFIDADDFPGALTPKGFYTVNGNTISLTLKLWKDGKEFKTVTLSGETEKVPEFIEQIIKELNLILMKKL
jgi:hypothetical protein